MHLKPLIWDYSSNLCEYCGVELCYSTFPASQWHDEYEYWCENINCKGEKEPECDKCGLKQQEYGSDFIVFLLTESDKQGKIYLTPYYYCKECYQGE